jgi:murein DD-endopeptidase MepM/ murein hydrolase activator NlpD
MRILFFRRINLAFLLIAAIAVFVGYHFYGKNLLVLDQSSSRQTLMAISPVVPTLPFKTEAAPPTEQLNKVQIEKNQTFSEVMQAQGIETEIIHKIYESAKPYYNLGQIRAGKDLEITMKPGQIFSKLEYSIDPTQTLVVRDTDREFESEIITHATQVRVNQLGGMIQGSLYSTIDRLGETDDIVIQFAEIFEWDVDFFKDLQAGDSFRIVYEKQFIDNRPYGVGKILAAELTNRGKLYQAIGYEQGKNWEYFSPDGKAMKKAFLASPLKFNRISSGFTTRRYHPLLKRYRPHYGIDYAAPAGTPVRAIGRGRVILAGWSGGAGKTIKIQHDKDIQTVYCHLSRFASGVKKGAPVSQGQVIGYVGSTGLATGPHLDFRFLRKGQYVNFLSVKSPQAAPLTMAEVQRFQASTSEILDRLRNVELREPPPDVAFLPAMALRLSESIQ